MKHLPIGIIDSGFGGLTVARQCLRQLPNESVIYLGDSARCPYGPRPLNEVKRYVWQMSHFLREQGIKMLVIACNTATAAALDDLRSVLSIPVVGVVHAGSRVAIKMTENNKIGVIATQGTIDSNLYEDIILAKADRTQVYSLACPEFVSIVEDNLIGEPQTQTIVNKRLAPLVKAQVDTLVLGCTHYPMLKSQIQKAMGPGVSLVDSGVETIDEVSGLLDYFNLGRTAKEAQLNPPKHIYYTTGDVKSFRQVAQTWLRNDKLDIRPAHIKGEVIVK